MSNTTSASDVSSTAKLSTVRTGLPVTKECTKCRESFPLSQFHNCKKAKDGLSWTCKKCTNLRSMDYRNSLSDAEYLFTTARYRSKFKGKHFAITLEDVEAVMTYTCPYLEIPIKRHLHVPNGGATYDDSISLDRINSDMGYVPGNIIVCSWRANNLLKDGTLPELSLLVHNFRRILLSTKPTNHDQTLN